MKMKRIVIILLASVLLASSLLPGSASANSARTQWSGVSGTGMILTGEECPIVVTHELLTFDIQQFPEQYYSEPADYLAYTGTVSAEYTFHNPADYTVTASLLFPFGNIPDYGMLHDWENEKALYRTDSEKYGVAVNGEKIQADLRHSFAYPYDTFNLYTDLARLWDGYAEDPFYHPELPVKKYTFHAENVDHETYDAATAAIALPFGEGSTKYVMVENNGFDLLEDGFRLSSFIGPREADNRITLFVIGAQPKELPRWRFYKNGACEAEIEGTMVLDKTEDLTFLDVAMSQYPTDTACSPEDWYNAVVVSMNANEYADGFVGSDYSYGDGMFDVNRCLMRWYAYEITLKPGETLTNTVTAPVYPDIDGRYEPPVYAYKYLLSPAKTWKEFGSLDIVINTPFYMTQSGLEGFEKTESGYALSLEGLPEWELQFSLCAAENPSQTQHGKMAQAWSSYFFQKLLLVIIPMAAIILAVILHRKRKNR